MKQIPAIKRHLYFLKYLCTARRSFMGNEGKGLDEGGNEELTLVLSGSEKRVSKFFA